MAQEKPIRGVESKTKTYRVEVSVYVKAGLAGVITGLPRLSPATKAYFEESLSRKLNGRVIIDGWRDVQGYKEIILTLMATTEKSPSLIKFDLEEEIKNFYNRTFRTLAPIEAKVISITETSLYDETLRGILSNSMVKYFVVGMGSGLVLGLVIFGLFRFLRR